MYREVMYPKKRELRPVPPESGSSGISMRFPLSLLLFNRAIFIRSLLQQARCHSFQYPSGINGNNAAAELGDGRAPRHRKCKSNTLGVSAGRRQALVARPGCETWLKSWERHPGCGPAAGHVHRHSPALRRLNTCIQREAVGCFFPFLFGTTPLTLCKTNTWR